MERSGTNVRPKRRFSFGVLSGAGLLLCAFFFALLSSVMPQKANAWSGSFSLANTGGTSPRGRLCDTFTGTGMTNGSSVTITLNKGSMSDPYLHLFRADGTLVAQNDDGNGNLNSRLVVTWAAGYYIGASTYGSEPTGRSYTLNVSAGTWTRGTNTCGVPPKSNQTITFDTIAGRTYSPNNQFTVSASATSALPVSFSSSTTTICTVSGTTVTVRNAGTCSITASQSGNTSFNAAPNVTRSFAISKANQTITFGSLSGRTYSPSAFSVSATASSGLTPTFTSLTTSLCTVSGSNVTMLGSGTCTIGAAQGGNTNYNAAANVDQSFTISKANQTITFNALTNRAFGSSFVTSATSTSGLAVTFSSQTTGICTTSGTNGTSISLIDVGTCIIRATQAGNSQFNVATQVDQSFTVTQASQALTFNSLENQIYGVAEYSISGTASSTSSLQPIFTTATPSVCSTGGSNGVNVSIVAAGTCTINADQPGSSRYLAAPTVSRSFTVSPKALTAGSSFVASRVYNGSNAPGAATVGAVSGLVGSETLNITATASVYSGVNVGSYSTTLTFALADGTNGGRASNYVLASRVVTGSITVRSLTFKIDDVVTDADLNTLRTFTATPTGLAPTDSVNTWTTTFTRGATSTTTQPSPTLAATYTMTPSGVTLTNGSATVPLSNYSVTYQTGTYVINTGAPNKVSAPTFSGSAVSGNAFGTQPVVQILDSANNVITVGPASTAEVKAIINSGMNRELVGTTTVNAREGVARFTNLGISGDAAQTYTIEYSAMYRDTSNVLQTLTSATQSVRPSFGTASALRISRNASGARSGIAVATQPTIEVIDNRGNLVTNSTATVTTSVQGTGAALTGTVARSASGGVASSFNLVLTGTAREASSQTPLNLVFSSPGLTAVVQEDIPLGAGNASKLTLTQRSVGTASGATFATQPQVMLFDASNNVVDNVSATVTATLTQVNGTGALVGGATATTASANVATSGTNKGIAVFSGLGITGLQNTTYAITYSATVGGVVLTPARQDVTVTVGAPTSLVLVTNASGAASAAQISTQPRAVLRDSGGNNVTSQDHNGSVVVTAAKSTDLAVAATVTNGTVGLVSGVSQWLELSLFGEATTYLLTYTYTGTTNDITLTRSGSLALTAGAATKLKINQTSSSTSASGSVLGSQPIVAVADAFGNTVTNSSAVVTATMSGGSGTLSGTVTRSVVSGVATYSGLSIRGIASTADDASKYILTFTSPGLDPITQIQAISVTHGAASKTVVTNPADVSSGVAQAGKEFAVSPVVQIQDAWGNVVTTGSWATALIRPTAISGSLVSSAAVAAVQGQATMSNVGVNGTAGTRYVVQYQGYIGATVLSASSHDVTLSAGDANRLRLSTSPVGTASGSVFSTQPVVAVIDSNGNTTTSTQTVTATIISGAGGTLVGGTSATAVDGVATFEDLGISGIAGVAYRIQYSISGSSITATSSSVTVTPGIPTAVVVKSSSSTSLSSGSNLATSPVIKIVDATGNTVTTSTANITVSLAVGSPTGSLLGTTTRQASNGEVTFSSLGIRGLIGRYTLEFSSFGLTPTTQTGTINLTPGPAAKIVAVNASDLTDVSAPAGGSLSVQPVLRVTDISGNAVGANDGARATLTPSISTGASLVNSVAVKTCAQGGPCAVGDTGPAGGIIFYVAPTEQSWGRYLEAARNGWNATVDDPSVNYGCSTLILGAQGTAIGTGATNTAAILAECATAGIAARVADNYSVTVGGVVYNDWFVGSRDENYQLFVNREVFGVGNLPSMLWNSNNFEVDIAGHLNMLADGAEGGAHKTSQYLPVRPIRAVAGPAAAVGISGSAPTVYSMTYSGTFNTRTLTTATHTVTAAPGAATKIVLTTPAVGTASGEVFATQPRVTLRDVANNTVDTDGVVVTMTITQVSNTGALVGGSTSTTATTIDGVATFSGIGISGTAGQAYVITYSAPSLTSTSQSITVTHGAPAAITFANSSSTVNSGSAFVTQPVVRVVDATGNVVSTSAALISAAISRVGSEGIDGELIGQTAIRAVNGVATFTNLGVSGTASIQYAISYSIDGFSAQTQTVTVQPGNPVSLAFGNSPSTSVVATAASVALGTQPQVVLKDSAGNVTVRSNVSVAASISTGGTLTGTTSVSTNASGIAAFTNLSVGAKISTYTLTYSATGLTPVAHTVTPTVGPAARIVVDESVKKIKAASGSPFNIDGQVRIVDAAGNTLNTNATITATSLLPRYYPSGPQTNVPISTVTNGGWSLCWSGTYSGTDTLANIQSSCDKSHLMYAGSVTSSPTEFILLAAAPRADVFAPTIGNATTLSNGTYWYYNASSSIGFAPDSTINLNTADIFDTASPLRMSWHTNGTSVFWGWRLGSLTGLGGNEYTRYIYETDAVTGGSNGVLGNGSAGSTNSVSVAAVNGIAPLNSLRLTGAEGDYTVTYSATVNGTTVTTDSNVVNLSAGAASNVVVTTNAAGAKSDAAFITQPRVAILDAATGGNLVASRNSGGGLTMTAVRGTLAYVQSVKGTPLTSASSGYCYQAATTQINEDWGLDSPGGTCTNDNFAVYWSGELTVPTTRDVIFKTRTDDGFHLRLDGNVVIDDWVNQGPSLFNATSATQRLEAGKTYSVQAWMYENAGGAVTQLYWNYSGFDEVIPASFFQVPKVEARIKTAPVGATGFSLVGTTQVDVVSGIASFTNLGIKGPVGTYTLEYVSGALTASTHTIAVVAGDPFALNVAATSTLQAGAKLADQAVTIVDSAGNPVIASSSTISASVTSANAANLTVRGTRTRGAVNGVVTFDDLVMFGTADTYTLTFTTTVGATTLTSTQDVTVTPGVAARLDIQEFEDAVIMQSGELFTPQPTVRVVDAYGNAVSSQPTVVFTLEQVAREGQSSGVLVGADAPSSTVKTVTAGLDGVAQFSGLGISGVDTQSYRVVISSGAVTPFARTFTLTTGDPTQVVLVNNAGEAQSNKAVGTQPVVEIRDSGGNVVNVDNATVTIASSAGASFTTATALTTNGVARFSGTIMSGTATVAGTSYIVTYSSTINGVILTPATQALVLTPGDVDELSLTRTVRDESAGEDFTEQPVVSLVDASDNPVNLNGATVTASIDCVAQPSTDCAAARLIGITEIEMIDGVATFTNLGINGKLATYSVKYSLTVGVTTYVTSQDVVVLGGVPSQMELATAPLAGTVGDAFGTQPVINLRDSSGNIANSTAKVTATITPIDVFNDVTAQTEATGELVGTVEKNAVSGVVNFTGTGLGVNGRVGQLYVITYRATGLTPVTHTVSLSAGSPVTMTVVQGIGDASSGDEFGQQPIVELYDVGGNLASGTTLVSASATSVPAGGGTLSGTTSVSAVNGRVVFTDVMTTGKVGSYTVTFTATDLTSQTSSFVLNPGAPSALSIVTSATSPSESGIAFVTQPVIELRDAQGNVITDGEGVVVASISSGVQGSLRGVTRASLSSGVAGFETLGLTGLTANNPYTIEFALQGSGVAVATQSVQVAAGPAAGLSLTESLGTQVGVPFADQPDGRAPVIRVVDSGGNTINPSDVFSNALITATVSTGGTLIGDIDIDATNGVVTFTDLGIVGINNANYTVTYSTPGLASVSQTITAATGPASQITLSTPAGGARSGAVMSTQPVVQLRDAGNNPVSLADIPVSVSVLGTDAILSGTSQVNTNASGTANFEGAGLELNGPLGTDYTVQYSAQLLPSDVASTVTTTQTIRVELGDPYKLALVRSPAGTQVGQSFVTQPIIEVQDFGGNTVGTATDTVSVSISRQTNIGDASKLAGTVSTTTPTTTGGIAEFTNLSFIGTTLETYRLTFSSGTLQTATHDVVATTGVPAQITVETAADDVTAAAGVVLSEPVVVKIRDVGGNVVDTASIVTAQVSCVVALCGSPQLNGDTIKTSISGTATFDNLILIGVAGDKPTVTFELSGVDTDTFTPTISVGPAVQLGVRPLANNETRTAQSGMELSPPPIVEIQDAGGNLVMTPNHDGTVVTATVTPVTVGGVPTGVFGDPLTTTVATSGGVAQFSGLSLTGTNAVSYTISYTANIGTEQDPGEIEGAEVVALTTGISTNISLSTPAVGTQSGVAFTTSPIVAIRDTGGNTVENSTYRVRATLSQVDVNGISTGRFEGTPNAAVGDNETQRTIVTANGVATFTGLGITGTAGETYTITYQAIDSSGNVVDNHVSVTQDIVVTVGPAVSIAVIREIEANQSLSPVRPVSGQTFATQPIVEIRDSGGNRVTSSDATITARISQASDSSIENNTNRTLFTQSGSTVTDVAEVSIDAVDGVATFESLGIKGQDSVQYTIEFSTNELANSASDTKTQLIQPIGGVPSQIVISGSGASSGATASGAAFGVQPQITIRDAQENTSVSSTSRILATLTTIDIDGVTTGEFVGTAFADAISGVANFGDLGITGTKDQIYTVTYSLPGVPSVTEQYTVGVGASTKLRFITLANGAVAGEAFTTQPVVEILDSGNNRTSSTSNVYATLTQVDIGGSLTGELVGTSVNPDTGVASTNAIQGVATFNNVGLGGAAGTAYTITYSSTDGRVLSTVDQAVTPVEGESFQVGILREADNAVVGSTFAIQPRLAVQDYYGNVVTDSSDSVVATVSSGGTLIGATTRQAINGIVEFNNLGLLGRSGESYTISYSLVGFTAQSQEIELFAGSANRLTISQLAAGALSGTEFVTKPQVTINDADGNIVTTSTALVEVTVRQVSGTGVLIGTQQVTSVNGVATFGDLGITGLHSTAYELTFSSTGLVPANQALVVSTGPVTTLAWDREPSGSVVGAPFVVQPRIVLRDSGRNIATGASKAVVATLLGVGGTLTGDTSVVPVNGIATFDNLGFVGTAGNAYTITYSVDGASTLTQSFTASVGSPQMIELTQEASDFVNGALFDQQPTLTIRDGGGNVVVSPRVTVIASLEGIDGALFGTLSRVSVNGVVRFSGLGLNGVVGNNYTLRFTASGALGISQSAQLQAAQDGIVPVFGAVNATADGFRAAITNFDDTFTYSGTATSGGLVTVSANGVVSVSGLLPGRQSTATITSSRNGYSSISRTVTGAALPSPALVPAFGTPIATQDGFNVQVTNYSTAFAWTATTDTTASATLTTAGVLRVTGASPGESIMVTIGTTRFGFLSGLKTVSSSALQNALTPQFGVITRTSNGFTVPISNFDSDYTWPVSASSGALATINTAEARLEVTGLAAGQESTVTLKTIRTGFATGSAVVTSRAISEALVPLISDPEPTATGWTATINNFDADFTWSYSMSTGTVVPTTLSSSQVHLVVSGVSGLTPAQLTVSTQRSGYQDGSYLLTMQRENGLIPQFGLATSTQTSFEFSVSNFDEDFNWSVTSSAGFATISAEGEIEVTNLSPATIATITVDTQRFGYTSASASFTYASVDEDDESILLEALEATFDDVTSTVDGFTVAINNFDPLFTWTALSTRGDVTISQNGIMTVTGLGVGEFATVTVISNKSTGIGQSLTVHESGIGQVLGSSITGSALSFTLSTPTPTPDGFTVQIVGYTTGYTWDATVASGLASVSQTGLVTITGQTPGQQNIEVTVTAERPGYAIGTQSTTGSTTEGVAYIPTFGRLQSVVGGFSVPVTNFNTFGGTLSWAVESSVGQATMTPDGVVEVTGLEDAASANVRVTTTHANRRSGTSTFTGGSLREDGISPSAANELVPTFGILSRTSNGFTVAITNFDSRYTYSAVLTRAVPAAATISNGLVTVTGIEPGHSETVTVLTNRAGFATGNATITGIALDTGTRASNLLTGQTLNALCTTSSPAREGVSNINDLSALTPFACFNNESRAIAPYIRNSLGFYTGDLGSVVLESVTFTSIGSSDDADRDPATFSLSGCVGENQFCSTIVSNDRIGFAADRSSRDITKAIRTARAYNYYKLTFGSTRGTSNMVQIGEVSFTGRSAIAPALNPVLTAPVVTSSGFTTSIRNHSNLYVWSATVTSPGIVSIGSIPDVNGAIPVTVTNLLPNTEANLTINTSRMGHQNGGAAQSVTTSMGVGLAPLLSQPTITSDGFRVRIENFNSSEYLWSARVFNLPISDADLGEIVEISQNGLMSVTGKPSGDSLRLVVSTSRVGYINGASTVDAQVLRTSPSFEFDTPTPTSTGFTVQIKDYTDAFSWRAIASNGATAVISDSGLVTVTNLGVGVEADVVVTKTRPGYVPISTTQTASSLQAGRAPVFGSTSVVEDGFTVQITNYDPTFAWSFMASNGAAATFDASTQIVTVSQVSDTSYLTVSTSRSGYRTARASTGLTFEEALVPEFKEDTLVSSVSGASIELNNFDAAYEWEVAVTPSGRAVLSTTGINAGTITVSGAPSGVELAIRVFTSRTGYQDGDATYRATTGLQAGLVPSFAEPIRLVGGYSIEISNFDPSFVWQVTSSSGTASIINGTVLVTGLDPIETASVTATTTKLGHVARSADGSGSALPLPALVPRYATPISTVNGFTTAITNYDATFTWTASVTQGGTAIIESNGTVRVNGIGGLSTATLTVTTTRTGYISGGSSTIGTSLPFAPLVSRFGITQSSADGFTAVITNFDPLFVYEASSSDTDIQAVVTEDGRLVVTGADMYDFVTVDVVTSRRGYTDGQSTVSAFALEASQISLSTVTVIAIEENGTRDGAIVTTNIDHGVSINDEVVISGIDDRFDGRHIVRTVIDARNFTIDLSPMQSQAVQFLASHAAQSDVSQTPTDTQVSSFNDAPISVTVSGVMRNGDERQIALNMMNPDGPVSLQTVIYIPYSAAGPDARFTATALMSEAVPAGYRMMRLTAENADGSRVENLNVPVRIKLARPSSDAIPVYSGDGGTTWRFLTRLETSLLPEGVQDGYYLDADGEIWVLTRHLSMFGALAPQAVPIVLAPGAPELIVGQSTMLTISGGDGDGAINSVSLTPEICSLTDSNTVTALTVGECIIEATKDASGRFVAATNRLSLSVSAARIVESPAVESPVVESPVVESPVVESPLPTTAPKKKPNQKKPTENITTPATSPLDIDDGVDTGSDTKAPEDEESDLDQSEVDNEQSSSGFGIGVPLLILMLIISMGVGVSLRRRKVQKQ